MLLFFVGFLALQFLATSLSAILYPSVLLYRRVLFLFSCVEEYLKGSESRRCPVGESDCEAITLQNVSIHM